MYSITHWKKKLNKLENCVSIVNFLLPDVVQSEWSILRNSNSTNFANTGTLQNKNEFQVMYSENKKS
jgi:hypothetical protein